MRAVVSPGRIKERYLNGILVPLVYIPPPSKSYFQRLCAAALLRCGTTIITNPGRSQDDAAALRIIEDLGATVERDGDGIRIISTGTVQPRSGVIHCGESGLAARLFTPIAALSAERVEIHGEGSLLSRPMRTLVNGLQMLGVSVDASNGYLPLAVQGPLQARSLVVDATGSSQDVSGLLFALAEVVQSPITLQAKGLVSRPYVAMSCEVLGWLGRKNVRFDGIETCFIDVPRQYPAHDYPTPDPKLGLKIDTEGDWSSIAPIAVAAAFGSYELEIDAVRSDCQADAVILDILARAGADVFEYDAYECCIITPRPLVGFSADCTHSPDLIPILTILATACKGRSRISGLHRLTHKESDRAKTTSALLTALGITHSIKNDAFVVIGPQTPRSNTVSGHNDHRIVMAAAIAALRADGPVTIEGAEAVRKSYPVFFEDLQKLGVHVEVTQ